MLWELIAYHNAVDIDHVVKLKNVTLCFPITQHAAKPN